MLCLGVMIIIYLPVINQIPIALIVFMVFCVVKFILLSVFTVQGERHEPSLLAFTLLLYY